MLMPCVKSNNFFDRKNATTKTDIYFLLLARLLALGLPAKLSLVLTRSMSNGFGLKSRSLTVLRLLVERPV